MIPRILHQIWLGPGELPEQFAQWSERWAELHPGWRMLRWSAPRSPFEITAQEGEVEHVFSTNYTPVMAQVHYPEQRTDIYQLELLWQYGGFYAAMDCQPLRPIDDLADRYGAVVSSFWHEPGASCCAFMGSTPGHAWIRRCLDSIAGRNPSERHAYRSRMISLPIDSAVALMAPTEFVNADTDELRLRHPEFAYGVRFPSAATESARKGKP